MENDQQNAAATAAQHLFMDYQNLMPYIAQNQSHKLPKFQ